MASCSRGIAERLLDVGFPARSFRSQDLRQMQRAEGKSRAIDDALELHQATGVDGDDGGCAGLLDGIDLGARHGAGDLREFDGERAAEAAAFFGDIHFSQREALNFREQLARTRFDAQFAQRVAAIVIGDDAVESRADIFDAGDFEEESRKLPDSRLKAVDLGEQLGDRARRCPRNDARSWTRKSPRAR
jgi:hypothetical protein